MKRKAFLLLLTVLLCLSKAFSQGVIETVATDEAFTLLILANKEIKTKTLVASDALLAERYTALDQMDKVMDRCAELEEEFSDYLSSFHELVVFAAQAYGFYLEYDDIENSLSMIRKEIREHPKNLFAVFIDGNRNKVVRNFVTRGSDIINDVYKVCVGHMTAADRLKAIYAIRPKLALLSRDMRDLARVIRYTSFIDVWYDLTGKIPPKADKAAIARESMERWSIQVAKMEPVSTEK